MTFLEEHGTPAGPMATHGLKPVGYEEVECAPSPSYEPTGVSRWVASENTISGVRCDDQTRALDRVDVRVSRHRAGLRLRRRWRRLRRRPPRQRKRRRSRWRPTASSTSTCSRTTTRPNNGDVPLWAVAGPGNVSATGRQSRFGFRVTGATFGIGERLGRRRSRLLRRLSGGRHRRQHGRRPAAAGQRATRLETREPRGRSGLDGVRAGQPRVARRCGHSADGRGGQSVGAAAADPRRVAHQAACCCRARCSRRRLATSTRRSSISRGAARSPNVRSCRAAPRGQRRQLGRRRRSRRRSACPGHYGRSRVLTPIDRTVDSRGVAADWSAPLGRRLTIAGEAFAGRNLAAFQAGIFQGINAEGAIVGAAGPALDGPRSIRTRGGWTQVVGTVTPTVSRQRRAGASTIRSDADFVAVTRREARVAQHRALGRLPAQGLRADHLGRGVPPHRHQLPDCRSQDRQPRESGSDICILKGSVPLAAVALSNRRGSPLSVRLLFAALCARRRRTRAAIP